MPMTAQNKVNDQIFGRINKIESKVDSTNGYLKGVIEMNEKLIGQYDRLIALHEKRDRTLSWIIWALLGIIVFIVAIVGYGAIGKDGMFSVRETMPTVPTAAIPAHNDFDKWRYKA